jgi:hypothetical protein
VSAETANRVKDKCLNVLFISMIVISVTGLVYNFLQR